MEATSECIPRAETASAQMRIFQENILKINAFVETGRTQPTSPNNGQPSSSTSAAAALSQSQRLPTETTLEDNGMPRAIGTLKNERTPRAESWIPTPAQPTIYALEPRVYKVWNNLISRTPYTLTSFTLAST